DAPWADEARAGVERSLARLRQIAAEASLASGDPFTAAGTAQQALDHDPYDEHALRLLMRAHVAAGRPASALAAYAQTRELLADALGTSPSAPTEALHLAILREELEPEVAVAASVTRRRPQGSRLPGRDRQWRALDTALRRARGGVATVVVEGEAGMGKTRLLEEWTGSTGPGATVLQGTCDPFGSLAFQAVLDALDDHLGRVDAAEADRLRSQAGPVLGSLLRGGHRADTVPDPLTAQAVLFGGALDFCRCAAGDGVCVLVVDDAHLADTATVAWVRFVARRPASARLLVVLARRPEGPMPVPDATRIDLEPLDLAAVTEIVGTGRAGELLERCGGNPLFLVELAGFEGDTLPDSILESVWARCAQAGDSAPTLRTAAVLGTTVDLDLLAGVLHQSAVTLLGDLEVGQRLMILEERGTTYRFRHELVREALVAGTSAARRALVHREAARLLAKRPGHDPLAVATHARNGGDLDLAARSTTAAAAIASARFDHAEAERLLDRALELHPSAAGHLARGRVRLTREDFAGATRDADSARRLGAGADALELASWSAYYRRDFDTARALCRQAASALGAGDTDELRRSVMALAGRIAHADGALQSARDSLESAVRNAEAGHAGVAGVWLGWLLADRGMTDEAVELADAAALDATLAFHPFGAAHRSLLAAYAAALQGHAALALELLDEVDREVEARHLDHFAGRTANYRAWVLRNLMAGGEADDLNEAAAEIARTRRLREPAAQAALDLADAHLRRDALDDAAACLARAETAGAGYAFSWKARSRHRMLAARLALADGRAEEAAATANEVALEAARRGTPRHEAMARVLAQRALLAAGERADARRTRRLLDVLARVAAPEAWWMTAEVARDAGVDRWWDLAEERIVEAAAQAGGRAEAFLRQAGRWMDKTRTERRRG
ncbi:MAG TPA: AAA family ATPase, partial [Acidimicrobiales bacterium]|nr:AAA family ATPase [Acidimicrobiales bacterium]